MNSDEKLAMIRDLMNILGVRSVTNSILGRTVCQAKIENIAKRMGFKAEKKAKSQVLVISPKGLKGNPKLGIIVHSDTVDTDEKEWRTDPYGEIIGERLYGRGVIDDKMGIIVSLHALNQLEGKIEPSWQVIIGSREEDEWTDMQQYFEENNPIPEFSITVDGDGVQHGCRGTMNVMFYFDEDRTCRDFESIRVYQPQWNVTPSAVKVTYKGDYDVIESKAMHTSIKMDRTENGIYKLSQKYRDSFMRQYPGFIEFMEMYANTENAEGLFISRISEEMKSEGYPDSDICLTMIKTEFGKLGVGVNVRLAPGVTKEEIEKGLSEGDKAFSCTHSIFGCTLSSYISPKSREIQLMLSSYEKVLGHKTQSTFALGTGYNATFPNCAIFGPRYAVEDDEEDFCHQVDESRKLSDIYAFESMLEDFIEKYLSA